MTKLTIYYASGKLEFLHNVETLHQKENGNLTIDYKDEDNWPCSLHLMAGEYTSYILTVE